MVLSSDGKPAPLEEASSRPRVTGQIESAADVGASKRRCLLRQECDEGFADPGALGGLCDVDADKVGVRRRGEVEHLPNIASVEVAVQVGVEERDRAVLLPRSELGSVRVRETVQLIQLGVVENLKERSQVGSSQRSDLDVVHRIIRPQLFFCYWLMPGLEWWQTRSPPSTYARRSTCSRGCLCADRTRPCSKR